MLPVPAVASAAAVAAAAVADDRNGVAVTQQQQQQPPAAAGLLMPDHALLRDHPAVMVPPTASDQLPLPLLLAVGQRGATQQQLLLLLLLLLLPALTASEATAMAQAEGLIEQLHLGARPSSEATASSKVHTPVATEPPPPQQQQQHQAPPSICIMYPSSASGSCKFKNCSEPGT